VLEEKATACNMLCCYADELKEGFYPWIDQVYYCTINISNDEFFQVSPAPFQHTYFVTNLRVGCPHVGPSAEVLLP
jgi:hypothetical protein